jgi:hypothetical protein
MELRYIPHREADTEGLILSSSYFSLFIEVLGLNLVQCQLFQMKYSYFVTNFNHLFNHILTVCQMQRPYSDE